MIIFRNISSNDLYKIYPSKTDNHLISENVTQNQFETIIMREDFIECEQDFYDYMYELTNGGIKYEQTV